MNRAFNSTNDPLYTADELATVRDVLGGLGYVYKPEGAYYPEPKLSALLEEYVRTGSEGQVAGIVTLEIDPDKTHEVRDGVICIVRDRALIRAIGQVTTVHVFADLIDKAAVDRLNALNHPQSPRL